MTMSTIRSIIEDCLREALAFKWIESQKAGYDLGDEALKRWAKLHWKAYLKARRLEHIEGKIFWQELDHGDFGMILNGFDELIPLLYRVLEATSSGKVIYENLNIINWALDERIPTAQVRTVLLALRINDCCRLQCPLTPADSPPTSSDCSPQ